MEWIIYKLIRNEFAYLFSQWWFIVWVIVYFGTLVAYIAYARRKFKKAMEQLGDAVDSLEVKHPHHGYGEDTNPHEL